MARIHYFQRYSSYENAVTNNFLQLLARIYDYSSAQASRLLTELIGTPVDIGIEVIQQTREKDSIPDGTILQRSFKILVEAKVDAGVDIDQLLRHSTGFSSESQRILLLLTKQKISDSTETKIHERISVANPGVIFKNITYEAVCVSISTLFKEHEEEMVSLCNDFVEYCNDTDLFDQSRYLMRILPCGESVSLNKKYGVYFHPSDRGYTKHSYIGIYAQKAVQCIWKIDSVFDVRFVNGGLEKTLVQGRNTEDFNEKILAIIAEAKTVCGYEISTGHRFFCGKPEPTNYVKSSSGGIQGARFENLKVALGGEPGDVPDIAERLRKITWE